MRWEALFADLEAQAEALTAAERSSEIAERTRSESGRLGLVDRLRAAVGSHVRIRCPGDAGSIAGVLVHAHSEWILLSQPTGREVVIVLDKVQSVLGLNRGVELDPAASSVEARLGTRFALRRIARDRSGVRLHLVHGTLDGTIDRVGQDFLDLAVHAPGEARRHHAVQHVATVPLSALVTVTRQTDA